MAARKKPVKVLAPLVPLEPPRPPCPPEWRPERRWDSYQHTSLRVRQVVESIKSGDFHIPVFQRPYVWTDAQVVRLLDSLVAGYHVGPLLCWQRYRSEVPAVSSLAGMTFPVADGFEKMIVIDGQQRLSSLAIAFLSGRFGFDFRTRSFTVDAEPNPNVVPLGATIEPFRSDSQAEAWMRSPVDHAEYKFFWLEEMLCCADISIVIMPQRWPVERVVESYRRLATEGTPMAPEHLANGLARFAAEAAGRVA